MRKRWFSRYQLSTFNYLANVSVRYTDLLRFFAIVSLHTVGCVPFHMSAVIPVHVQSVSTWCAVCCGADWRDTVQCMGYTSFHTCLGCIWGRRGGSGRPSPPPLLYPPTPPQWQFISPYVNLIQLGLPPLIS